MPARILLVARVLAPLAVAASAILFRQQIVNLIDRLSGLGFVFTFVHLYSTASARAIIGALAFAMFAAIGAATYQFAPRRSRAAIFAGISAILLALFLWYSGRSLKTGLMVGILSGCLIAANAVSSERWSALLASRRYGRWLNLLFWICIGIEFLLPRAYLAWNRRPRLGYSDGPASGDLEPFRAERSNGVRRRSETSFCDGAGDRPGLAPRRGYAEGQGADRHGLRVRGIAIDPGRDLLLAASFLTNDLDVIDLKTGRSLRRYRLGPWMRTVLVPGNDGIAYVASRYGVYRLNYLR